MKTIQTRALLLFLLAPALALSACGGGGGGRSDPGTVIAVTPPGVPAPIPPYPDPIPQPPVPPADPPADPPPDPMHIPSTADLAFDADAGVLYAVDNTAGQLLALDAGQAQVRYVGAFLAGRVTALTFRADTGQLYALFDVDPAGQGIAILDTVQGDVQGVLAVRADLRLTALEWHDVDQRLYAVDEATDMLVALDGLTGDVLASVALAVAADIDVRGLAFEPTNADLVAFDALGMRLVVVDRSSGALGREHLVRRPGLTGLALRKVWDAPEGPPLGYELLLLHPADGEIVAFELRELVAP